MNSELLSKLARDAGFFANPEVEKFQKFAELIVKECCDIIRETRWAVPPTQEQIAKNLMERLGVE